MRQKRGLYQNFLKRFDWTTGYRYDNPHDNYVKCLYLCHLSHCYKLSGMYMGKYISNAVCLERCKFCL